MANTPGRSPAGPLVKFALCCRYAACLSWPHQTDYTSTFVENSKLRRQLLKVEKDAERLQSAKERDFKSATKTVRIARVRCQHERTQAALPPSWRYVMSTLPATRQ